MTFRHETDGRQRILFGYGGLVRGALGVQYPAHGTGAVCLSIAAGRRCDLYLGERGRCVVMMGNLQEHRKEQEQYRRAGDKPAVQE